MAFYEFVAYLADGSRRRECQGDWDNVPHGIRRLSLIDTFDEREVAYLDAIPGGKFYFYNEVVAARSGMGVLSGKGIGLILDGIANEIRMDIAPDQDGAPVGKLKRYFKRSTQLNISDTSFRRAAR